MDYRIEVVIDDSPYELPKRKCINCGNREVYGAGSICKIDGSYIQYADTWDRWCRRWKRNGKWDNETEKHL